MQSPFQPAQKSCFQALARLVRAFGLLGCWLACQVAVAVELNTASEADLDAIRGSGPATTARILAARQAGPFVSWPDLIGRVRGIGPATAAKWSAQGVTVNGQPWDAHAGTGYPPPDRGAGSMENR